MCCFIIWDYRTHISSVLLNISFFTFHVYIQPNERRKEKGAVWDNRHGYENKMPDDDGSWNNYDYNNAWNNENQQQNATKINYNTPPTYVTATSRQQPPQSQQQQHHGPKDGFSTLFVHDASIPSWDD